MRVDINQMQEMTLPCPHQGTGQMSLRAYVGQGEKLVSCTIHPGGSIGLHSHPSSDDLHFVLMGTGVAICDGEEELLEPGVCHICKRGSAHSIQNTGPGDLVLLTVEVGPEEKGEIG